MKARSWTVPLIAAAVIAAGIAIALLQSSSSGYLDPGDTTSQGGHALADLLTERGQRVIRVTAPGSGDGLQFVTSPSLLSHAELRELSRFDGDLILVDPDAAELSALAPAVQIGGQGSDVVASPDCQAQALAGDADLGGTVLRTTDPAATTCYPNDGGYSLIQYADGSRVITVLGNSTPLTNGYLADYGDAALALNLLRTANQVIWLVPSALPPASAAGGQQSFFSLVPEPVDLIALQLCVAALLAAAWRARRLGPVVAERLPVIVRASETVEGHGRLYQARRARGRAAGQLRAATRERLARAELSTSAVAAATGRDPDAIVALLDGPAPATDAELVALASDLDTLEREALKP